MNLLFGRAIKDNAIANADLSSGTLQLTVADSASLKLVKDPSLITLDYAPDGGAPVHETWLDYKKTHTGSQINYTNQYYKPSGGSLQEYANATVANPDNSQKQGYVTNLDTGNGNVVYDVGAIKSSATATIVTLTQIKQTATGVQWTLVGADKDPRLLALQKKVDVPPQTDPQTFNFRTPFGPAQ